ncbi:hypothetical protein [Shewanella algae]|uniref:hypothetical protein n=1 Tax=Shewanella algae TaxID=38313 RepID=UPI003D7D59A1
MRVSDISDYSIRFIGLDSKELDELEESKDIDSMSTSVGRYFKDKSKYNLIVKLTRATDVNKLATIINLKKNFNIDLFISVSSNIDNQIIELPGFIVELIALTKLRVNLSFTFTVDD